MIGHLFWILRPWREWIGHGGWIGTVSFVSCAVRECHGDDYQIQRVFGDAFCFWMPSVPLLWLVSHPLSSAHLMSYKIGSLQMIRKLERERK